MAVRYTMALACLALLSVGSATAVEAEPRQPASRGLEVVTYASETLLWSRPADSPATLAKTSYEIYGFDEEGGWTHLSTAPPMSFSATIPPGFDLYGVAPNVDGRVGALSVSCINVDPNGPNVHICNSPIPPLPPVVQRLLNALVTNVHY